MSRVKSKSPLNASGFNRKIHGRSKSGMQFILAIVLFVVVIGAIDAGVPWPRCRAKGPKQ
jgi:hypothetical protein